MHIPSSQLLCAFRISEKESFLEVLLYSSELCTPVAPKLLVLKDEGNLLCY